MLTIIVCLAIAMVILRKIRRNTWVVKPSLLWDVIIFGFFGLFIGAIITLVFIVFMPRVDRTESFAITSMENFRIPDQQDPYLVVMVESGVRTYYFGYQTTEAVKYASAYKPDQVIVEDIPDGSQAGVEITSHVCDSPWNPWLMFCFKRDYKYVFSVPEGRVYNFTLSK